MHYVSKLSSNFSKKSSKNSLASSALTLVFVLFFQIPFFSCQHTKTKGDKKGLAPPCLKTRTKEENELLLPSQDWALAIWLAKARDGGQHPAWPRCPSSAPFSAQLNKECAVPLLGTHMDNILLGQQAKKKQVQLWP